jgi:hypothetical protein
MCAHTRVDAGAKKLLDDCTDKMTEWAGRLLTAVYVSSYCYVCVLLLLYMCPHAAIYVSSYCYTAISVLILLYMCPHTAIHVSSYEWTGKLVALANAKDKAKAEQDRMKLEREKLRFFVWL